MNEQEIKAGGWIVNEGKQPVEDDVLVDVVLRQGTHHSGSSNHFDWMFVEDYDTVYDITHWRLHKDASTETSKTLAQEANSWIANEGERPDIAEDSLVEIVCKNGQKSTGHAWEFCWESIGEDTITHWRECSKQSLETAYDVPPKSGSELQRVLQESLGNNPESYYKAPETKYSAKKLIHLHKKSAEQQVVDIFNQATGNSLTEKNLKDIINLLNVINQIGE